MRPLRYAHPIQRGFLLCDRCFLDMRANPDDYRDDADSWEGTLLKRRAAKKTEGRKAP